MNSPLLKLQFLRDSRATLRVIINSKSGIAGVAPYALSYTPKLEEKMVGFATNVCRGFLMHNHRALCLETDIKKAVENVVFLEKSSMPNKPLSITITTPLQPARALPHSQIR